MKTILVPIVALSLLLPSAAAAAPRSTGRGGGQMLTLWGAFDPGPVSGIGLGGRLMFPVVPEGILHAQVRDEISLELGMDLVHYSARVGWYPNYVDYSWTGFLPVVGAMWSFWLTPRLAVYPKLDLGYWFGWYSGWDPYWGYDRPSFGGLFIEGAVGVIYRLQSVSLRAELGSGLLRLGVGFPF